MSAAGLPNNSSTGGYLVPVKPIDDGDGLTDLLQGFVAGITGLAGDLVRPRWQPTEPVQPEPDVNWAALGITTQRSTDYPEEIHTGATATAPAFTTLTRYQTIDLVCSFYGPLAKLYAETAAIGIYLQQNRAQIAARGVKLIDATEVTQMPELVNTQWINRCDLTIRFRRALVATYAILDIVSAGGVITTDPLYIEPFQTPVIEDD